MGDAFESIAGLFLVDITKVEMGFVGVIEGAKFGGRVSGRELSGVHIGFQAGSSVPLGLDAPLPLTMGVEIFSEMNEKSRGQDKEDRPYGERGHERDSPCFVA